MSNTIGTSTIYGTILPNNYRLSRIRPVNLSKQAKHRLTIIDHYLNKTHNVSLTCRHYAISRSYFYKWYNRYNPRNLKLLENRSTRPKKLRQTTYNYSLVRIVRKLRKDYPSYSSKKLAVILKRDHGLDYSASTLGRIIQRYGLYFRSIIQAAKQRSKRAVQTWKKRKPYDLKASCPGQIIEFDMKHIYAGGQKQYAFVAVDIFSKEAVIHVASRPSSWQARIALEKAIDRFGKQVCILNDNGSENLGYAYDYLSENGITQYFARPHTPKDKPHVENIIGKLQLECLDEDRSQKTIEERQMQVNRWLNDYHFFRPHQALNYLTPSEFCDTLGVTIRRLVVSTM